ncbi:MAG TPA: aminoacetone oxidase family FAD-binding enzyme, partial [Oscillospiraceae bacterium]|nr:aminoacetone oxidase family FAD-binding enzyme [Oscillospiraceae bacterium]
MKKIAIIGGGASGLAAAIEALRLSKKRNIPISVTIYEKLPRICKKVLVTGNGRCNLCNADIKAENYRGNKVLINAVINSDFSDTLSFFNSLGLLLKQECGRIYPKSGNASSVADALRYTALSLGCEVSSDTEINKIERKGNGFLLNDKYTANAVILASGGAAAPYCGTDGNGYTLLGLLSHKVSEVRPALVPVKCGDSFFKSLKGIRSDAAAVLYYNGEKLYEETGEIQFTEYGLSGIPILNMSGLIDTGEKAKYKITLDLCPDMDYKNLYSFLETALSHGKPTVTDVLTGIIPKRLCEVLLKRIGISPLELPRNIKSDTISKIVNTIKCFNALVTGTNGFRNAQVTAGGLSSEEINLSTLSSKHIDGLYICGELLDAYGICGGYNLHFAWTTGRIAGYSAAVK